MGSRLDSDAHQFMISRVVCDFINAITEPIVGSQLGRKPIGQYAEIDNLWFAQ